MDNIENIPAWLRLSDEAFDAAWRDVLDAIRSEGNDPDAMVAKAAERLDAWHAHPAVATFRVGNEMDEV